MVDTRRAHRAPATRIPPPLPRPGRLLWCVVLLGLTACTAGADDPQPPPTPTPVVTGTAGPDPDGAVLLPPDIDEDEATTPTPGSPAGAPVAPPATATLAWLSGVPDVDALQIDTEAGVRWHGPVGGEWAMLTPEGYRWFGNDGSAVGCVLGAGCVGFDRAGNTVVTFEPGAPRIVYSPGGDVIGFFDDDGDPLPRAGRPDAPAYADALAETGVDVAALLDEATAAPPFAGGATGDPHLITAGGERYTTQALGHYVARAGDGLREIQLQFAPMAHRDEVTIVTGVAIRSGGDVLTVDATGVIAINSQIWSRATNFTQRTLSSEVTVGRWPTDGSGVTPVVLAWPDGGTVALTAHRALGMTVVTHLPTEPGSAGLFGTTAPTDFATDLLSRQGTAVDAPAVISSWRVPGSDRLFSVAAPTWVSSLPPSVSVSRNAREVAEQACRDGGLTRSADVNACTFDVAVTGDIGFVTGHLAMATAASANAIPGTVAARWPALSARGVPVETGPAEPGLPWEFDLAPGDSLAVPLNLPRSGPVAIVHRDGCAIGADRPGLEAAAVRVFDAAGHPVSGRLPVCGHTGTAELPAGDYLVVVAAGADGRLELRADVTAP